MVPSIWQRASTALRAFSKRSYTVPPISLKDPALARLFREYSQTTSGVVVTYEMAMTYSAVYDAVNQISSDIAKMPLNHMKRRSGGGADVYTSSRLFRLLKAQPNPEMGSMVFRRQMMVWALTTHGGYAEIQRDGTGTPVALWPIEPHRVQPYRPTMGPGKPLGPLTYKIDGKVDIDDADMLVIAGIGYCPGRAYSLLDKARQAVGLALAAERFGAAFFSNGLNFGGILTTAGAEPSPEQKQEIRDTLNKLHQGVENAHRFALLWGGFEFEKTGISPSEAQMNDLRDKQVEEVARFYRIQPSRLGLNKAGTVSYASVEMQNLDYYTGCLLDWITLWEEELNRKLIPALEARQQFIKHNVNVFLRGDIKSRYEALGIARDKGIINANEWRDLEEMPPQNGSQGDEYLVQTAQTPLRLLPEFVQSQIDLNAAKTKQAEAPPAPATVPIAGDLAPIKQRAEAAEALAEEWRTKAADLSAQVSALEASGSARASEIERITADLQSTQTIAANLTALSTELQRSADQAEANAARAIAAQTEAETARAEAEARISAAEDLARAAGAAEAEARSALAASEAVAVEAERRAAELRAASEQARADQQIATDKADELSASLSALQHEIGVARDAGEARERDLNSLLDTLRAELDMVARRSGESAAQRDTALQDNARLTEQIADAQRLLDSQRERAGENERSYEQQIAALASARETATMDLKVARAKAIEAEVRATEGAQRFEELRQSLAPLRDELVTLAETRAKLERAESEARSIAEDLKRAQQAITEAEVEATRAKTAEAEAKRAQVGATAEDISARHALYVTVMEILISQETERGRRHQQTPEKFRKWFEGEFYDDHAEHCIKKLLPYVRMHLAFLRSDVDPETETRRLVNAHIAESQRQLRVVMDDREFVVTLPALFAKWDQERAHAIPNLLMQREIDHVRSR